MLQKHSRIQHFILHQHLAVILPPWGWSSHFSPWCSPVIRWYPSFAQMSGFKVVFGEWKLSIVSFHSPSPYNYGEKCSICVCPIQHFPCHLHRYSHYGVPMGVRKDCMVLLEREANTEEKLQKNEVYLMGFMGGIFGLFLSECLTCL